MRQILAGNAYASASQNADQQQATTGDDNRPQQAVFALKSLRKMRAAQPQQQARTTGQQHAKLQSNNKPDRQQWAERIIYNSTSIFVAAASQRIETPSKSPQK